MLVMLAGIDYSGKSTMAKFLGKIMKADVIHFTERTPNDYTSLKTAILAAKDKNVIFDRGFYDQFVYQTQENRRKKEWLYGLRDMNDLELLALSVGVAPIFCFTSEEQFELNYISRNGQAVEEEVKRLHKKQQKKFMDFLQLESMLEWLVVVDGSITSVLNRL